METSVCLQFAVLISLPRHYSCLLNANAYLFFHGTWFQPVNSGQVLWILQLFLVFPDRKNVFSYYLFIYLFLIARDFKSCHFDCKFRLLNKRKTKKRKTKEPVVCWFVWPVGKSSECTTHPVVLMSVGEMWWDTLTPPPPWFCFNFQLLGEEKIDFVNSVSCCSWK